MDGEAPSRSVQRVAGRVGAGRPHDPRQTALQIRVLSRAAKLSLRPKALQCKVSTMETNWASDHLQTIRTLMERSALYRRALAPIMIVTGSIGLVAAVGSRLIRIESDRTFGLFWLCVSLVALIAALLLVRRQALNEAEPFWSPPMRRVVQALLPAFFVGFVAAAACAFISGASTAWLVAVTWIVAYGCALHAAGFFMERGIKLFGWVFILSGSALLLAGVVWPQIGTIDIAHYLMGTFFGVLHLAYGIYLYFTEKRTSAV